MAYDPLLIADSGSTKTTWCLLNGEKEHIVETQGISPYFLKSAEIKKVIVEELLSKLSLVPKDVARLYFYGTGLASPEKAGVMRTLLSEIFSSARLEINHDLTGAARALCLHEEGLACILGTGSGACYFDGKEIVRSSPGLGFILGDEGSGAYLGKMLIQSYLYQTLDTGLVRQFEKKYHPSKAEILRNVYQEPYPNRYLASYARFLGENRDNVSAKKIIKTGIGDFLCRHVKSYKESEYLPVHFVGGVARAFEREIRQLCSESGLRPGRVLGKPIEGLIRYHRSA